MGSDIHCLSEGYRRARRNSSIVCGISMAWAASQFELKVLTISNIGNIDISGATIPLVCAFAIIYTFIRSSLEFVMQIKDVRRWLYAQYDYRLILEFSRIALLLLAATGLARSLNTSIILIACIPVFFLLFIIIATVYMIPVSFVVFGLGRLRGRTGAAAMSLGASIWAMFFAGITLIAFIIFGVGNAVKTEALKNTLNLSANFTSITLFTITAILVTISYFYSGAFTRHIFAHIPRMIEIKEKKEDGTMATIIKDNPKYSEYIEEMKKYDINYRI